MKTYSKIVIALGAIAMMAGIAIGCSKTCEEQSTSLSNETKQAEVIPDGLYFAQEKIKNGEVLTYVDKIENGISVKSTVIKTSPLKEADEAYKDFVAMLNAAALMDESEQTYEELFSRINELIDYETNNQN